MEGHLTGEDARDCAGDGALPVRSGEAPSTHSVSSGTKLLDRGWTLFFSEVAQGVRHRASVWIPTSHRLSAATLKFTPVDKRIAFLRLRNMGGGL